MLLTGESSIVLLSIFFLSLHHQLASTSVNSELLQVKLTVYTLFETVQVYMEIHCLTVDMKHTSEVPYCTYLLKFVYLK